MLGRFRPRLTYANVVATLALVLGMGGGAYAAIDSIPGSGGVIHACYAKRGGDLRLVSAAKKCRTNERAIAFNQGAAFQASTNTTAEPLTLTLTVPAGSYTVVAKAIGSSDSTTGSDPGGAECVLGWVGDSDVDDSTNAIPPDGVASFADTVATTFVAPTTIVYTCSGSGGTPPGRGFGNARIVATQVGSVH